MNDMKRNLILVLALCLSCIMVLAGCGGDTDTTETETDTTVESIADAAIPEDGVYTVDVTTDSTMFHLNETANDQGTLAVENGKMTLHITLVSKNIVNLYAGTAEDAQKDGAELIEPTLDTVTYEDGMSEEVYGFDIPITALDQDIPVAIIGTHGNWYDHTVHVSNPVLLQD